MPKVASRLVNFIPQILLSRKYFDLQVTGAMFLLLLLKVFRKEPFLPAFNFEKLNVSKGFCINYHNGRTCFLPKGK